mmetsp:Transcript_11322/g.12444  ORF Transcript_11322/g.12444 Transcript_11322/m.12444 type:complete len:85 (+) Transcript_11322:278-532(+)
MIDIYITSEEFWGIQIFDVCGTAPGVSNHCARIIEDKKETKSVINNSKINKLNTDKTDIALLPRWVTIMSRLKRLHTLARIAST